MNIADAKKLILDNSFASLPEGTQQAAVEEAFPPENQTLLHEAARMGCIKNIPPRLLTPQRLSLGDKNGRTPLHLAACYGCLDQIPQKVLSSKLLKIQTNEENNVLHVAASAGHFDQTPEWLISADLLLQPNKTQKTTLDYLISSQQLSLLENKLSIEDLSKITHSLGNQPNTPKKTHAWFKKALHQAQLTQAVSKQNHGAL